MHYFTINDGSNGDVRVDKNLLSRISGLDAVVRQMLREDLPIQLAAIRAALDSENLAAAKQHVHAVRGSAAFCKLDSLREAATVLEQALNERRKNADHTRAFENSVNTVLHALENYK